MVLILALVAEGLLHHLEFLCAHFMSTHLPTIQIEKTWIICAVSFGVTRSDRPHGMGDIEAHTRTKPWMAAAGRRGVMNRLTAS